MGQVKTRYCVNYRRGWDRIWGRTQGTVLQLPPGVDKILLVHSPHSQKLICSIFVHFPESIIKIESDFDKGFKKDVTVKDTTMLARINLPWDFEKQNIKRDITFHYVKQTKPQLLELAEKRTGPLGYQYPTVSPGVVGNMLAYISNNFISAYQMYCKLKLHPTFFDAIKHVNCPTKAHGCKKLIHQVGRICRRQVKHVSDCQCSARGYIFHARTCLHFSACSCPCECDCCKKTCSCICRCPCCSKICLCKCMCDLKPVMNHLLDTRVFLLPYDSPHTFVAGSLLLMNSDSARPSGIFYSQEEVGIAYLDRNKDWIVNTTRNNTKYLTSSEVTYE